MFWVVIGNKPFLCTFSQKYGEGVCVSPEGTPLSSFSRWGGGIKASNPSPPESTPCAGVGVTLHEHGCLTSVWFGCSLTYTGHEASCGGGKVCNASQDISICCCFPELTFGFLFVHVFIVHCSFLPFHFVLILWFLQLQYNSLSLAL